MTEREHSICLPTLRNINMPIGTFLRIGEPIDMELEYQCHEYIYISYIFCHNDRKRTFYRSTSPKKCKTLYVSIN